MTLTHWPLQQLRLRTPRLELRLPSLQELDALAELSTYGVHDPAVMPFLVPWTDLPPAERARGVMQFHWRQLAEWTPEKWSLPLVVLLDGEVAGTQCLQAEDFAVLREVSSGSWLGRCHQGRGVGTEMRAAVLHLAFAGLGADSAITSAFDDNVASLKVTRRLGYRPNGRFRARVRDQAFDGQRFVLDRPEWDRHRTVEVEIEGLAACRSLFGVPAVAAVPPG